MKDDTKRPTTSNILDMPFLEKYMKEFILERERQSKKEVFDNLASATVNLQQLSIPRVDPTKKPTQRQKPEQKKVKPKPKEVKKMQQLTAKEQMMLRKEEAARKKFELMTSAAKTAKQNFEE